MITNRMCTHVKFTNYVVNIVTQIIIWHKIYT